ncbi:MOSC domain-containing protein [Sporosarcina sp. ANT_H38]|uniref:MOSC domain-containing protein n=1 Tax=Sporosarcina sp. ANT_H38 TaxID=2597358 RepID=UPI0011F31CB8|nr:MOSC domain-containing protein [Sporosarcina sp. ANT_H38]KAA0966565.1 MOSC domain-containing protein [Sporosarcina sp. ANT_H38]
MTTNTVELKNFSIGLPKKMKYGTDKEMETGICKEMIEEAFLTKDGFRGDGVADLRHHGGLDRAVCVYPYEHYSLWEQEFTNSLPSAAFGENITVTNMLEQDIHIGDIFRLGDAVIQIAQGRIPCSTITKRTDMPPLLKRMVETGFTGYLCRVLEEGTVRKDSTIALVESHPKQVSILFANQIYFHRQKDIEGIKKVLDVQELAHDWRERLTKRLETLTNLV